MSIADRTFGNMLMQFARAVDHVNDATFKRVGDQVKRYVERQLDIQYFEFKVKTTIDETKEGLVKVWASEGSEGSDAEPRTIFIEEDGDQTYRDQSGYAFKTRQPLWIISPDKEPLYDCQTYIDCWSKAEDIPVYNKPIDRELKTSIIVPVRRGGDVLGVVNLESSQYVEATGVAQRELKLLADSIGLLYYALQSTRLQSDSTSNAIGELRDILDAGDLQPLTKPHIFIASSHRADNEVMGLVNEVLDSRRAHLEPILWSERSASGNITQQILEDITRSRFGLCYFSAPAPEASEFDYEDSDNVVFEAGMLHSLTNAPTSHPTGWIPIREENSPPTPFDFAQQRMLIVPRLADGGLNREAFVARLEDMLDALLDI